MLALQLDQPWSNDAVVFGIGRYNSPRKEAEKAFRPVLDQIYVRYRRMRSAQGSSLRLSRAVPAGAANVFMHVFITSFRDARDGFLVVQYEGHT